MLDFRPLLTDNSKRAFFTALALAASSVLIGNFFSIFIFLILLVTIVSSAYSFIRLRTIGKDFLDHVNKYNLILSLAFLTTLIVSIILPYLFFHDYFLDLYLVSIIYLVPLIFIFFLSLQIYSGLLSKAEISFKKIILVSLLLCIIISSVLLIGIMFGVSRFFNGMSDLYITSSEKQLSEFKAFDSNMTVSNQTLLKDIKGYSNEFIANFEKKNSEAAMQADYLCISSRCLLTAYDNSFSLISMVLTSFSIQNAYSQATTSFYFIESGAYKANYSSLKEYESYLDDYIKKNEELVRDHISEVNSDEDAIDPDMSYKELKEVVDQSKDENSESGLLSLSDSLFDVRSPYFDSLSYALKHTVAYRETSLFMLKTMKYVDQIKRFDPVFIMVFENMDPAEPEKSRIARKTMVYNRLESYIREK